MAIIAINYKGEKKEFNVVKNTDIKKEGKFGIKVYTLDGIPCLSAVNVHWADKDKIEQTLHTNMTLIEETIKKKTK